MSMMAEPAAQELVKTRSRLNIMSEGTEDGPSGGELPPPFTAAHAPGKKQILIHNVIVTYRDLVHTYMVLSRV